ncbi:MAG: sodium extrusion protein NatB [Planctomycetaceae bacterium]|nr:MAG: sodium extrusion protein NatB [Planctomycetaceae bacterium]
MTWEESVGQQHATSTQELRHLLRLAQKECRETLRDRRTLFTLLGMPVLVYPLLGVLLQQFVMLQARPLLSPRYHVLLRDENQAAEFKQLLRLGQEELQLEENAWQQEEHSRVKHSESWQLLEAQEQPWIELMMLPSNLTVAEALQQRLGELAVEMNDDDQTGQTRVTLWRSNDPLSQAAYEVVLERLEAVNHGQWRERLLLLGESVDPLVRWTTREVVTASPVNLTIGSLIPLVLILLTVTGAVYPAIDLTAGERERGTFEAVMATPVSRTGLLLAKYAAVLVVVWLTALTNLAAMLLTAWSLGLDESLIGTPIRAGYFWWRLGGLLILFGVFFSAVMLSLTSLARSFKEAQAYLVPLLLLTLLPGSLALWPGMSLTWSWSVVPVMNLTLLAREVMDGGRLLPGPGCLTLMSTLLYAASCLLLAARWFGSDAVLTGGTHSWSESWRRPMESATTISPHVADVSLLIILPGYVWLSGWSARTGDSSIFLRLWLNSGVLLVLFLVWPSLCVWYRRQPLRAIGGQTRLDWRFWAAALCWGLAVWPGMYGGLLAARGKNFWQDFQPFQQLIQQLEEVPLAWRLLTLAVVPAWCEEWYFRGVLFTGWRQRWSTGQVCVFTSLCFAAFHVLVGGWFFPWRALPAFFLGLLLGWLREKAKSIWPGIILHAVHNGVLVSLKAWFPRTWGEAGEAQLPPMVWVGSTMLVVLGVWLVSSSRASVRDGSSEAAT